MDHPEAQTYAFGPFRISTVDRLLMRDGNVVPLAPKVVDTLMALLASSGRVIEKSQLIEIVWPETFVEEGGLAQNISQLRKTFGKAKYIETIPTRGYRWIGPLQAAARESVSPPPGSVLVLPLENQSRDPGQEYFASGMTEAMLTNLAKISALKVISHPGTAQPALEAGRQWNAEAVLVGAVLADGERVRITARLVRTATGEHLWADQYEAPLRDVLELQGSLARRIAAAIHVRLTLPEQRRLAGSRPVDPEVFREYLKGRYHWNRRSPHAIRQAIEHFQRALDGDPVYAPAYTGLADSYALLGSTSYDAMAPRDAMPKAKAAALKAIEVDDSNGEAHASLGYVLLSYDWNWKAAEQEFTRALELNPGYATAHQWYAHYLLVMGRLDEAALEMRSAQERDPLSLAINLGIGWCSYLSRRYDESVEQYQKTLELDRNFVLAHTMLGMAYERKQMYQEAIAEFRQSLAISPGNPFTLARLGQTYAVAGNRQEAEWIIAELELTARTRYVPAIYPGAVYAGLGDRDHAFACVHKAHEQRSHFLAYIGVEPSLDDFRSDPRFPALRQLIGL